MRPIIAARPVISTLRPRAFFSGDVVLHEVDASSNGAPPRLSRSHETGRVARRSASESRTRRLLDRRGSRYRTHGRDRG